MCLLFTSYWLSRSWEVESLSKSKRAGGAIEINKFSFQYTVVPKLLLQRPQLTVSLELSLPLTPPHLPPQSHSSPYQWKFHCFVLAITIITIKFAGVLNVSDGSEVEGMGLWGHCESIQITVIWPKFEAVTFSYDLLALKDRKNSIVTKVNLILMVQKTTHTVCKNTASPAHIEI